MTDRELLELAARAAGIEVTAVVAEGVPHRFGGGYWNPLTDDGDALRLAVRLNLTIRYDVTPDDSIVAVAAPWHDEFADYWWNEYLGDDAAAATRRAIVRAAAEIGRAMAEGAR